MRSCETWPAANLAAGGLIGTLDRVLQAVFVVEIAARLVVHRAAFWRDPWSVFDFVVVGIALVPASGPLAVQGEAGVREELRALRVQIERLSASLAAHGGREEVSR